MNDSPKVVGLLIFLLFFSVGSVVDSSPSTYSNGSSTLSLTAEPASIIDISENITYLPVDDGLSSGTDNSGGVIIESTTTTSSLEPTTSTILETSTTLLIEEPTTTTILEPETTSTSTTLESVTSTTLEIITPITLETTTSTTLETTSTTTVTDTSTTFTTTTLPAIGSELATDYEATKGDFSVVFKKDSSDYSIEFLGYGAPLRMKPLRISGENGRSEATLNPTFMGKDKVEYQRVFGGKANIDYEVGESRLKERIIFQDENDVPLSDLASSTKSDKVMLLSSSTMSVEYSLVYPDKIVPSIDGSMEWDSSNVTTGGDIVFIQKKEPHTLYAINKLYSLQAPFLEDSKGKRIDLTYTLEKVSNQTLLKLNIPPLENLKFPVIIDPTLNYTGDNYIWENSESCSTASQDCYPGYQSGTLQFMVPQNCDTYGQSPVKKPLFKFNSSGLYGKYTGSLDHAQLHIVGSCGGRTQLHSNERVELCEINAFSGSPSCEGQQDNWVKSNLTTLMKNNVVCDVDDTIDVTSNFNSAVTNNYNLSFKVDVQPARNMTDNPSSDIYYTVSPTDLTISYAYRCSSSSDCPSTDFCNASTTHLCQPDLYYGVNCQGVAADNDSLACPNNNCQLDDFDGVGKFCTESGKCVNDGNRYDTYYVHCNNTYGYKTCQGSTLWSSYTPCTYGCNETVGCVTTTTLPPQIVVTPSNLLITIREQ